MPENKAVEMIAALYERYGNWNSVGIALVGENGNHASIGAMANRAYNGGSVTPSLRRALGLYRPRFRRAIEFDTAEEMQQFDQWIQDQGFASATEWFKQKVWEVY